MQSSSEQPLVGEERYVTTRITAAKETTSKRACIKTQNDRKRNRNRLIFFNLFIYLLTIILVWVVSLVSIVSFRRFGFYYMP